jgi:hypothetical protein
VFHSRCFKKKINFIFLKTKTSSTGVARPKRRRRARQV